MPELELRQLRQLAFEVSVLADRDFLADDQGVQVQVRPPATPEASTAPVTLTLTWELAAQTLAELAPDTSPTVLRQHLLRVITDVDTLATITAEELHKRARPYALPRHSPMHLGRLWVHHQVMGGALDVGLAFALPPHLPPESNADLTTDPDDMGHSELHLYSPFALQALGYDQQTWWPHAQRYLDVMGNTAATKLRTLRSSATRSSTTGRPQAVLRPSGDADVVTLLASRAYRLGLAEHDHSGLCAVAVPMRRRGWIDLSQLDPAFIPTAYELTEVAERGFPRPLLVTADEVVYRGQATVA